MRGTVRAEGWAEAEKAQHQWVCGHTGEFSDGLLGG